MILPTRADIVELAQNGTLLDAVFSDRWECRYQHFEAIAQALVDAHSEGEIDLPKTLSDGALAGAVERYGNYRGYQGRRIYSLAIERLEIPVTSLLEALRVLADLAIDEAYEVSETLSRWCAGSALRPMELLTLIVSGQLNAGEFYSLAIAIRTGLKVDFPSFSEHAYRFIQLGSPTEKQLAIQALSPPPFSEGADWRRALGALSESSSEESSEVLRGALASTLLSWAGTIPLAFTEELETLIGQVSLPTTPQVAHHLAYALAFSFDNISPSLRTALLSLLNSIELVTQTQKLLDIGLSHLVQAGGTTQVRALITETLRRPESQVRFKDYDSVIRKLVESPAEDFEAWIVDWLRSAPDDLCSELNSVLLQSREQYDFQTDFNQFALTESEIGHLARRAIWTFFANPEVAASFLVCLGRCSTSLKQAFPNQAIESTPKKSIALTGAGEATSSVVSLAKSIRIALHQATKRSTFQPTQLQLRLRLQQLAEAEQGKPPAMSETSQDLSNLLFDSLLLNYTRLREKLESIADSKDDGAAPMVKHALDRHKQYCDALEEVGFIAELQPSERERQLEGQRRSDVMDKMMRESRQNSPLARLFSESILLHGNGMVTWVEDRAYQREDRGDGDSPKRSPRRLEQPLTSFSHSVELPREEVLDPNGLHQKLLSLKSQGRPA